METAALSSTKRNVRRAKTGRIFPTNSLTACMKKVSVRAMKKVLSLFVALIFLQVQTWALSGGPVFTSSGSSNLTGVYSGVLVARSSIGAPPPANSQQASLGVFSITVPISGAATGTTVFFQNNNAYTGTIEGAANPRNRTITGIIQATSTAHFVILPAQRVANTTGTPPNQTTTFQTVPAVTSALIATGSIQAEVSEARRTGNSGNQAVDGVLRSSGSGGGVDASGNPVSLGDNGDRLSGKATIASLIQDDSIVGGPTVTVSTTFTVSGIRQTNVLSTTGGATP